MTTRKLVAVHLEDDPLDRELVESHLRDEGLDIDIVCVETRDAYVRAIVESNVDVILSDFSLPRYDGMSALASARELAPRTPFLFVSGAIGEERAIDALRQGAIDYVLKARLQRLGPAVRRALREVDERRERESAERERDRLLLLEKDARRAAEAANSMKDDFLAIVSHELRTPLNAILGWTKLLQSKLDDKAALERGLATVERNALAQARLIEDVLDVSRIVTGKLELDVRRSEVALFVEAAVEALRPVAAAQGVTIACSIAADAGQLDCDAGRMQQVVWNLVSNAVKFTPRGGRVDVGVRRSKDTLEIEVADDGEGLAPDALPRVFERFYQADACTRTRAHRGLGLGLAIVRNLVEMHGGTVRVASDGIGRGAKFTVAVPMTTQHTAAADDASVRVRCAADVDVRGVKVLVVDDESDSLEMLRLMLEAGGASVAAAASVHAGLEAFATFEPHVLVCDIGMPHVDGYSMIRRVRALATGSSATPAIALTAFARDEDQREALAAGFQCHLAKPADPDVLLATIAKLAHGVEHHGGVQRDRRVGGMLAG